MSRLVGGVHTDVSGRPFSPSERPVFYLSVDRGLKSGKLDDVPLDERDLLRLVVDAGRALETLRNHRERWLENG